MSRYPRSLKALTPRVRARYEHALKLIPRLDWSEEWIEDRHSWFWLEAHSLKDDFKEILNLLENPRDEDLSHEQLLMLEVFLDAWHISAEYAKKAK